MEVYAVPSKVWAESVHTMWINFSLQRVKLNPFCDAECDGHSLQRL